MITAILAILLFCIMIFPHELGHYIAAKKCGVQVNEFAFGMGPTIWKKQRGETLHSIRLLPIGGFCAMEGEDGAEEDLEEGSQEEEKKAYNPRAFNNKKPWQRIIVLAAGSVMNVICAILIMTLLIGITGFNTTTIGEVKKDSVASKAGLLAGDKVLNVADVEINSWDEIAKAVSESGGNEITLNVERKVNSKVVRKTLTVTPEAVKVKDSEGKEFTIYVIGILTKKSHNPFKAVVGGVTSTWNMTKTMVTSIKEIFTGKVSTNELAGPVGMISMVSQTTKYGVWYYGFLTAMICLNLAIINMLPLPALDGGRIIFVIYSWITGKSVSSKVEGTVHAVGLILLMFLMLYVTKNDIVRLF